MFGAPGVTRIWVSAPATVEAAPWYCSSLTVVGCCVGESALMPSFSALARSAATRSTATLPPELPQVLST